MACSSDPIITSTEGDSGTTPDAGMAKDTGVTPDSGPAATYAVGGTITGIAGTGLILDNGGDTVAVAKTDKTFTFPKKLAKGASYSVKVKTQPDGPSQTCAVTAGDGSNISADVTTVKVDCTTNKFPITVTVKGLEGGGLVLQNNAGDDLPLTAANPVADVKGSFATKLDSGKAFAVTIKSQPTKPNQICTVTGGTGSVVSGEVSSIVVNCTNTYTIGGTVSGLAGKGLVLQNNAGDDIALNMNGTFAFSKTAFKGDKYAVTIKSQPTDVWQTCALTGDTGTVASADVTTVAVVCTTNQYAISGTITGLTGKGAVIQNNAGDDIALAAGDTKFAFATKINSGDTYTVTVKTNPTAPWQTCAVTANGGPTKVAGADITNVTIACTTNTYKVGGTVTGLKGTGLVLQNGGGDDLKRDANGAFVFGTSVASGAAYAVTIKAQPVGGPNGEKCAVTAGAGNVAGADVTNVTVTCVSGTLVGTLAGVGFYTVPVVGTMTDTAVIAACQAAGLTVPCQAQNGCQYNGNNGKCKLTPAETFCGSPMYSLSQSLCGNGKYPSQCAALEGVCQYMGEVWNANSSCGALNGQWCSAGNGVSNQKALCVLP